MLRKTAFLPPKPEDGKGRFRRDMAKACYCGGGVVLCIGIEINFSAAPVKAAAPVENKSPRPADRGRFFCGVSARDAMHEKV